MTATASGVCWGVKLSSAGEDESVSRLLHRRPSKGLMMMKRCDQFPSIRCCCSTPSSSSFDIPDIKFYTKPNSKHELVSKMWPVFLPLDSHAKLHRLVLRMTIRDDDGVLERKLAPFKEAHDQWCNKITNKEIRAHSAYSSLTELLETAKFLATGISGCLLEHVDSWICGYSAVLYEDFDVKFSDELLKLEPVLSRLYAPGDIVRSSEIFMLVKVYGTICDKDIHTREELLDVLQQLNTLESPNEHVVEVTPGFCFAVRDKAEVDVFDEEKVDKKEDYAHICLGKFP